MTQIGDKVGEATVHKYKYSGLISWGYRMNATAGRRSASQSLSIRSTKDLAKDDAIYDSFDANQILLQIQESFTIIHRPVRMPLFSSLLYLLRYSQCTLMSDITGKSKVSEIAKMEEEYHIQKPKGK
jgi:hypothetical protein